MTIDEKKQEEILKALILIQKICREGTGCDQCPFSDRDNDCLICSTTPTDWEITNRESAWKALH